MPHHRRRVQEAIAAAVRDGTALTVSAVARAAGVDRTFLYRRRDLLDNLHTVGSRSAGLQPGSAPASRDSLEADLANTNARAARMAARVQQLEGHLSRQLGERAWREAGFGGPTDTAELQATINLLEQRTIEPSRNLEERQTELGAARAANRELTRAPNQRG
ncbi:hypothetical protein AB0A76_28210 [Streptomyces exfoliatus]|uniref:Transposase n=1 Tax=Streptomyces exfoliatus TaxID=1905 RepID=A0ABV3D3I2_STREX